MDGNSCWFYFKSRLFFQQLFRLWEMACRRGMRIRVLAGWWSGCAIDPTGWNTPWGWLSRSKALCEGRLSCSGSLLRSYLCGMSSCRKVLFHVCILTAEEHFFLCRSRKPFKIGGIALFMSKNVSVVVLSYSGNWESLNDSCDWFAYLFRSQFCGCYLYP